MPLENSSPAGFSTEAIVVAVQRFYLSPEADAHTGVLRVSELRESFQDATRPS